MKDELRLRILVSLDSTFPWRTGGREGCLYHISKELRERAHFTFVTWRTPGQLQKCNFFPDVTEWATLIPVRILNKWPLPARLGRPFLNTGWFGWRFEQIGRRTCSRPYDVVTALNAGPQATNAYRLSRRLCVPCIIHYHSNWAMEVRSTFPYSLMPGYLQQIETRNLSRCDLIMANGHDTFMTLAEQCSKPVVAICNGVDSAKFRLRKPDDYKRWPSDKIVFISNSTLRDIKGLDVPMRCLSRMPLELRRNVILAYAGRGQWAPYANLAAELGISEQVEYLGEQTQDEIASLLRQADAGMFPGSLGVGTQLAALECLASGLPLLAYNYADYPALIDEGRTGYLVPLGDEARYQKAMESIIMERDRLPEMAGWAREKVDYYDWSRVADRYYAALCHVAGK